MPGVSPGLPTAAIKKITFARNIFGQITERTDPAGYRLGFRYDRFGRPKVLVNEKDESYRFEYDALHRLIRRGTSGRNMIMTSPGTEPAATLGHIH